MEKCILITGGAGFIGSNFINYLLKKYQNCKVINIDILTYAANRNYLKEVEDSERYVFVNKDINTLQNIDSIFQNYSIQGIIHFAAESHVDNSISGPKPFIDTNIGGTFNLLETARKYWLAQPFQRKSEYTQARFHHISTDEVYGSLGQTGFFTEETPYAPNSPYSASKASADMLVRAYTKTYGLQTVISNCSNNYGPHQHPEKLIPTIIRKALAQKPIPIYGDGSNIRDWLFVEDHCKAIDLVFHEGGLGETYAIGGDTEIKNIDIAVKICRLLDRLKPLEKDHKYESYIDFVEDRAGHDRRYAIDHSKITKHLSWTPQTPFEKGLEITLKWYLRKINN